MIYRIDGGAWHKLTAQTTEFTLADGADIDLRYNDAIGGYVDGGSDRPSTVNSGHYDIVVTPASNTQTKTASPSEKQGLVIENRANGRGGNGSRARRHVERPFWRVRACSRRAEPSPTAPRPRGTRSPLLRLDAGQDRRALGDPEATGLADLVIGGDRGMWRERGADTSPSAIAAH